MNCNKRASNSARSMAVTCLFLVSSVPMAFGQTSAGFANEVSLKQPPKTEIFASEIDTQPTHSIGHIDPLAQGQVQNNLAQLSPLMGRWLVTEIRQNQDNVNAISELSTSLAVVTFTKDGRLFMTAGCARSTGFVGMRNGALNIAMLQGRAKSCHKSFQKLQDMMSKRLDEVAGWHKHGSVFALVDGKGANVMTLERAGK